jgi:exodeoxyribonuclease VIII
MEIIKNLSDTEYHKIKAISASGIKEYMKSPKKYEYRVIDGNNKATKSMSIGTYAHMALLEPQRWESKVKLEPSLDKRTSAGKEAYSEFLKQLELDPSLDSISLNDFATVSSIRNAVMMHPDASIFFHDESKQTEITLRWLLETDGILSDCKARLDLYTDDYVIDLKTVKSADPRAFFYACKDYGYLKQAAWYSKALQLATGKQRKFAFICVETEAPYEVSIFEVPQAVIDYEFESIQKVLPRMVKSIQDNYYPSKCQGITPLWVPAGYWEEKGIDDSF